MIYEVDNYHDLMGKDFFLTLDGELVPACQRADTETGVVQFGAVSDDYCFYFDYEGDDFPILTRCGRVEVHVIDRDYEATVLGYIHAGRFLKPFPYEVTEGMRALPPPRRMAT